MSEAGRYIIITFASLAVFILYLIAISDDGVRWRYKRKSEWRRFFEDVESFRNLMKFNGLYSSPDDVFVHYKFDPERILRDMTALYGSRCTPDVYLNLQIIRQGGIYGIEEKSKALAKRHLELVGIIYPEE